MTSIKKVAAATALSAAVLSPAAMAQFSGNVGVVSDYVFRGLSESDGGAAVQGGIDYGHESGFYAGVWASTLSGGNANYETDLYAGYTFSVGDIDFDVGALFYYYRADSSLNTPELYVGAGFGPFSLSVAYDFEAFGSDDDLIYVLGSYGLDITDSLAVDVHLGYSFIDDDAIDDYLDWGVALTKDIGNGFAFSFGVYGTDISEDKEKLVVGLAKSFDLF